EVVVLGYLLRRFKQAGLTDSGSDVLSAVIRGSYHLYQGFGGFIGNLVMGLIFARLYRRWGRVMPLLVAHPGADRLGIPERGAGGGGRPGLPAAALQTSRVDRLGLGRAQRPDPRLVPPLPGVRRVHRQPGDGADLRAALPALGPGDAAAG